MLSLTFLGTSAARPTVERSVSAIALHREGETLLFDCGEGTQRQMMKYGVGFTLSNVFFTHFHSDHYLGFVGLVRTLGLQGRTEPMTCWGPKGARRILGAMLEAGYELSPFEVTINEVEPGDVLKRGEYDLEAIPADHGQQALGWVLRERDRLGRFDPDKARELGIPEGPLWGRIHKGETIVVEGGTAGRREVKPEQLVGPPRPGRLVVISGDTRPSERLVKLAESADLLVHEATFSHEEHERAVETRHSTAMEAAQVALAARVRKLVLTHVSARFSVGAEVLQEEARAVFPETVVARDGLEVDVPFTER